MSLVKRLFRILILLSILSLFIHILTLFTASGKKELQRSDEVLAVKRFLIYSKDIMKNRGHMVESMEEIPDTLMDSSGSGYSHDPDIMQRSKWQQAAISSYCSGINQSLLKYSDELYNHLLYDDKYGIIYCAVPKVGCTKMKLLFILLQGKYTLEDLLAKNVRITHKSYLHNVRTLGDLTASERETRLRNYYKYMIVRDPLERLVSVYLNKISRKTMQHKTFLKLRRDIIKEFRKAQPTNYNASNSSFSEAPTSSTIPTFTEFVRYFVAYRHLLDDHFQAMFDLCQPCLVKYDFYPYFHSLDYDIDYLLQVFGIPANFYFNDVRIGPSLMPKPPHITISHYYNEFDSELRAKLIEKLKMDIEFYYHLYPNTL